LFFNTGNYPRKRVFLPKSEFEVLPPKIAAYHWTSENFPHLAQKSGQSRSFSSGISQTIHVPAMGDSITEGSISKWLKQPGDSVVVDEVVVVIETDKVSVDVRAPEAGIFSGGLAEENQAVSVGQPLFTLTVGTPGSTFAPPVEATTPAAKANHETPVQGTPPVSSFGGEVVVPVPSMGDSISEGTIVEWVKAVGDFVAPDDVVVILETDKVSVDVRSPSAGVLARQLALSQETVSVGAPLFSLEVEGTGKPQPVRAATKPAHRPVASPPPPPKAATPPPPPPKTSAPQPPPAVVPKPPTAAVPKPQAAPTPSKPVDSPNAPVGAPGGRGETRVKMNRMRLRIAERLKSSQNTAAMLTTFQECDMGTLIDIRKTHKDEFEKKHGVKLGFMSAFVKASTASLQELPIINAYIDDDSKEIVYRDYIDISVAVSSPTGLVVPVLRNCEEMSFADVEKTIGMFGKKAKEGKLALEDMAGGTFTISNGGVFGSLMGTPIINMPQSAILGMHATKLRPVVNKEGQIVARPMMYLALTYDHRLIDGREAVTFLKSVAMKIEDPSRLVLGL